MPDLLTAVEVRNYRSLADVRVELGPINVFFGPNGGGKSSLLDALAFIRDCAVRDVPFAGSKRGQGAVLRWNRAQIGDTIDMRVVGDLGSYALEFAVVSGWLSDRPAERLLDTYGGGFQRRMGEAVATFDRASEAGEATRELPVPERLALLQMRRRSPLLRPSAHHVIDGTLSNLRYYHTPTVNAVNLRHVGSQAGTDRALAEQGDNLWSVLRNAMGASAADSSYATIVDFMRRAFPEFRDLVLEATGPTGVYASMIDDGGPPVPAVAMPDGYIQMLLVLAALFAESDGECRLILLDEPDLSLHPWALAVLADAVVEATTKWNRQVLIATHSPVLLSQFENEQVFIAEKENGATKFTRLSEREDLADLIDQYALGSLYMSGAVAPQGDPFGWTKEP